MVFKGFIAAATAVALSVAPTVAVAQTAAPTELAPASESVDGSELRGGFVIPVIAIVAILLGILAWTGGKDGPPKSP